MPRTPAPDDARPVWEVAVGYYLHRVRAADRETAERLLRINVEGLPEVLEMRRGEDGPVALDAND